MGRPKLILLKHSVKVAPSCPTLCDPVDYSVHGILQARILEWIAFPFSRGSSRSWNQTRVSCMGRQILYHLATWEAPLQWIHLANSTVATLSELTISRMNTIFSGIKGHHVPPHEKRWCPVGFFPFLLPQVMCDLISKTRNQTQAPCVGSMES